MVLILGPEEDTLLTGRDQSNQYRLSVPVERQRNGERSLEAAQRGLRRRMGLLVNFPSQIQRMKPWTVCTQEGETVELTVWVTTDPNVRRMWQQPPGWERFLEVWMRDWRLLQESDGEARLFTLSLRCALRRSAEWENQGRPPVHVTRPTLCCYQGKPTVCYGKVARCQVRLADGEVCAHWVCEAHAIGPETYFGSPRAVGPAGDARQRYSGGDHCQAEPKEVRRCGHLHSPPYCLNTPAEQFTQHLQMHALLLMKPMKGEERVYTEDDNTVFRADPLGSPGWENVETAVNPNDGDQVVLKMPRTEAYVHFDFKKDAQYLRPCPSRVMIRYPPEGRACFTCGSTGHLTEDCSEPSRCWICLGGHMELECPFCPPCQRCGSEEHHLNGCRSSCFWRRPTKATVAKEGTSGVALVALRGCFGQEVLAGRDWRAGGMLTLPQVELVEGEMEAAGALRSLRETTAWEVCSSEQVYPVGEMTTGENPDSQGDKVVRVFMTLEENLRPNPARASQPLGEGRFRTWTQLKGTGPQCESVKWALDNRYLLCGLARLRADDCPSPTPEEALRTPVGTRSRGGASPGSSKGTSTGGGE